jgi:hypothetical protein
MTSALVTAVARPPHPVLLPKGRRDRAARHSSGINTRSMQQRTLSQPYPLADTATLDGKLANASLRGERQSEGVSQSIQPELA